jgi:hypothetical protein
VRARSTGVLLCVLLLGAVGVAPARAARPLLNERVITETVEKELPAKQIEGACGVALNPVEHLYVSAYYQRTVFLLGGVPPLQIPAGEAPEGPCGLATAPGGALYVNYYHQGVSRLLPSKQSFDEGNSTGVAVDSAGNVYVDDRTFVAVYQPSGEPVLREGQPLQIGLGTIGDGYGVAVHDGVVYIADAKDETVKAYEPAVDPSTPSMVIDGSEVPGGHFSSLVDAALATDPTNGHLVLTDNLQPEYEHPEAVIYEFGEAGEYLGKAEGNVIDGEPTGLTFDPSGKLYATTGNSERANVFLFGPYQVGSGLLEIGPAVGGNAGPARAQAASPEQGRATGLAGLASALAPASPRVRKAQPKRHHAHPKHRHHTEHHHKAKRKGHK